MSSRPFVLAITGGICSGKSAAARHLASLGAHVIDADKLGHRAYEVGSKGHRRVVAAFGKSIINGETGEINRRALGALVFADATKMHRLTSIVWPLIRNAINEEIESIAKESNPPSIVVVEAAVLLEAGWQVACDETWLMSAPIAIVRQRLMQRNQLTEEEANKRIDSQWTDERRQKYVELVISSNRPTQETQRELSRHWQALQQRVKEGKKRKR